jgi:hypothetical protein
MLDTMIALLISVVLLAGVAHVLTTTTPKYGTEAGAIMAAAIAEAQADATSTNKTQTVIVVSGTSSSLIYEGSGNPYQVYTAETTNYAPNGTVIHISRTVPEVITASNGTTSYTSFSISAVSNGTLTMGPLSTLAQASVTTNPGCTYANTLTVTMGPETLTAVCTTGVVTTDFPSSA